MSGGRACHARFPRAVLTQSILAEPADPNIDPGLTWDLGPGIMDCVSVRNRGAEPSDPPHYTDKEQLASWLTSTSLCAVCCCWIGSFARDFFSLLTGKFRRQSWMNDHLFITLFKKKIHTRIYIERDACSQRKGCGKRSIYLYTCTLQEAQ